MRALGGRGGGRGAPPGGLPGVAHRGGGKALRAAFPRSAPASPPGGAAAPTTAPRFSGPQGLRV